MDPLMVLNGVGYTYVLDPTMNIYEDVLVTDWSSDLIQMETIGVYL